MTAHTHFSDQTKQLLINLTLVYYKDVFLCKKLHSLRTNLQNIYDEILKRIIEILYAIHTDRKNFRKHLV